MPKLTIFALFILLCGQAAGQAPALTADASNEDIVAHMLYHEANQTTTDALAQNFPDMDRERAYAIQWTRLDAATKTGTLRGWKLGWTRATDDGAPLDPILGHYMGDRVYPEGQPVSTRTFTESVSNAEPEIVFYLREDLRGPEVTRDDVIKATAAIGIAMEFVNWRVVEPRTRAHAIADNGIASGVILGEGRFDLADVDFKAMNGTVIVNGDESSTGPATSIMGVDPIEGMVWAANEMILRGRYLRAGEFVVSGTVTPPLPVTTGDAAKIRFDGLGSIEATFVE